MKEQIHRLDKAFENRIRLGIMTTLMVEDSVDYNTLKTSLDVSDGNLASHLKALESEQYIAVYKSFLGRKPNTKYKITKLGKKTFDSHLNALEQLISNIQPMRNLKK
jgi:DNA-binding PadR family transcriptional regulator